MGRKPKVTIPVKAKGRPKGRKNKAKEECKSISGDAVPDQLPEFLEIVKGQSYFSSNKGRLTNQEIIDNGLEFACVTGHIWNYKFKK